MGKQFLKKQSKRITTRKRFKIEKKVREHNRKIKKQDKLKKKNKQGKRKLIIVPGDCPFKGQILAEATLLKENILKEKLARKEQVKVDRKAKKELLKSQKTGSSAAPHNAAAKAIKNNDTATASTSSSGDKKPQLTMEDLVKKAQERGYQFEKLEQRKTQVNQGDASLKAFYKEFQQVVNDSDVVIEVLDARDPLGTRSSDAEDAVRNHSGSGTKKLVMVLNKCDLIPPENLEKWVTYLKQTVDCAVIPFKANTQKQKNRLGAVGTLDTSKGTDTKKAVGVYDLITLLGGFAGNSAGGVVVGVIGMPNVGKSSLINSLKRSKACNVGAKPGVTRHCQVIHLDAKLRLIDSPGICFSKETGNESITLEKIVSRVPKNTLMLHYGIPNFDDHEEFLCNIANKYGQLKKGGIPNTAAAENKLIHDWHTGAIRFFTEPPELPTKTTTSAAIVTSLSEPFSLDKFTSNNDEEMEDDQEDDDDVVEMDEQTEETDKKDPSPNVRVTRSAAKRGVTFAVDKKGADDARNKRTSKKQRDPGPAFSPDAQKKLGLVATKKSITKKLTKSKKKIAKKADELSNVIENMSF